ncbi:MAG: DUF4292 domain-containing protein [Prevotella sp.]|jgi:hypothetical protein|nr:DUF4292 domain-containing protein [Prevotella sp.]
MKPLRMMKLAALALPLMLVACGTQKKAVKETTTTPSTMKAQQFLQKVNDNAQYARFITSKVKFSVEVGNQQLTLTGNLKMKRDDVIRLQLMAFGFVEAGRLEFTKDYVLIMDRINKQFIKANYNQLDFMRNSGLNFYSLQSLFWNELFQPGKSKLTDELLNNYQTDMIGEDAIISMESDKLSYRWLADKEGALIKMANIMYEDKLRGNYQLNWDYEDFKANGKKKFPHTHNILFNTPSKSIKMGMTLNYLGNDEEWETRTEISGKYREVSVDEILRRFMAL